MTTHGDCSDGHWFEYRKWQSEIPRIFPENRLRTSIISQLVQKSVTNTTLAVHSIPNIWIRNITSTQPAGLPMLFLHNYCYNVDIEIATYLSQDTHLQADLQICWKIHRRIKRGVQSQNRLLVTPKYQSINHRQKKFQAQKSVMKSVVNSMYSSRNRQLLRTLGSSNILASCRRSGRSLLLIFGFRVIGLLLWRLFRLLLSAEWIG